MKVYVVKAYAKMEGSVHGVFSSKIEAAKYKWELERANQNTKTKWRYFIDEIELDRAITIASWHLIK